MSDKEKKNSSEKISYLGLKLGDVLNGGMEDYQPDLDSTKTFKEQVYDIFKRNYVKNTENIPTLDSKLMIAVYSVIVAILAMICFMFATLSFFQITTLVMAITMMLILGFERIAFAVMLTSCRLFAGEMVLKNALIRLETVVFLKSEIANWLVIDENETQELTTKLFKDYRTLNDMINKERDNVITEINGTESEPEDSE